MSEYSVLLRVPAVRRQALAGLVAQLSQGAAAVGIILVVRQHTGSLALSGIVVGVFSLAAGGARPVQGRLIDRRGATAIMSVCAVLHCGALTGIVVASQLRAGGPSLVALGLVGGASLPPVSTTMRVQWARFVNGEDRLAAYSLVYLTQGVAIVSGPLILAATTEAFSASFALLTIAAVTAIGTLAFAGSIRAPTDQRPPVPASRVKVLRIGAMQRVLVIGLLLGAVMGGLEVAAPTLATAHRTPAAAGLLMAALCVGGVIGAGIYGRRQWQPRPAHRLPALLALLASAVGLTTVAHNLIVVGALLLVGGLALNPALTTASLIIDQHTPSFAAAESFGWLSAAYASGTGGASALAAIVSQHHSDGRAAFVLAGLAGTAATFVASFARHTLNGTPPLARNTET